jgi:uncharacterized membrane protein
MMPEGAVTTMIFMLVLTVILLALVAATVWSAVTDTTAGEHDQPEQGADTAPVPAPPETLEGVLVRQLLDGEITGPQYRRAVHRLAQRDADRHPLSVPSEE